jgi:hypothetical protein
MVASIHSGTIQALHFDIGRFDTIGLLAALLAILSVRNLAVRVQVIAVPFLLGLVILVHEANFLMFAPMVFAYWVHRVSATRTVNLVRSAAGLLLIAMLYATQTRGLIRSMSHAEYMSRLAGKLSEGYSGAGSDVLFRDLKGTAAWTASYALSFSQLKHHLALACLLVPTLWLLFLVVRIYRERHRASGMSSRSVWAFISCAFSPLLLYPIGVDYFRWWAITFANLFLVFSLLAEDREFRAALSDVFGTHRWLSVYLIGFSLLAGPLCITSSFSRTLLMRVGIAAPGGQTPMSNLAGDRVAVGLPAHRPATSTANSLSRWKPTIRSRSRVR